MNSLWTYNNPNNQLHNLKIIKKFYIQIYRWIFIDDRQGTNWQDGTSFIIDCFLNLSNKKRIKAFLKTKKKWDTTINRPKFEDRECSSIMKIIECKKN